MTYRSWGALLAFCDIVRVLAVGSKTTVSYPGLHHVFATCD